MSSAGDGSSISIGFVKFKR